MVRVAVIGIGRIGYGLEHDEFRSKPASHVGAYLASPKTELVAVADTDKAKLENFRKEHPDIAAYGDYETMLNRERPEIVSVCTPVETHAKIVRNAARFAATKVIFCEKPIASMIKEAERMIRTCEQFQVKLAVNHTRRWDQAYRRIKRIVDGDDEVWKIGSLLTFAGRFSGDAIRDGVHMADLAQMMKEKNVLINLLNLDTLCLVFEADFWCEEGLIRVLGNGSEIQLWFAEKSYRYQGFRELGGMTTLKETYNFPQAMLNAVDDLVECASSDKQPDCTGVNGMNALKLVIETKGGG